MSRGLLRSIDIITAFDQNTLPGWEGQKRLSVLQDQTLRTKGNPNAKDAAVMVILIMEKQSILLMERTAHPNDKHSGQLSFPGGKHEMEDQTFRDTAIRETEEEIGLKLDSQDILGALTPLYIPVSGFLVHPFVTSVPTLPTLNPDPNEVAAVMELPLASIFVDDFPKKDITTSSGLLLKNVPIIPLQEKYVWGATGMILGELSTFLFPYLNDSI